MTRPDTLPTTALILAAGLATRMRPLTDAQPKALLPIGGKALIDHTLDRLSEHGITQAVVNVHHCADMMEAHLNARTPEPKIVISDERAQLMDTGGGAKKALPLLGSAPILMFNGKCIWTDGDRPTLYKLADAWDPDRMDALLLLAPTDAAIGYDGAGDFDLAADGTLSKTSRETDQPAPYVFTGIQLINPAAFADTPDGPFSMRVIWDRARANGRLFGQHHDGDWMQVWTVPGLKEIEAHMAQTSQSHQEG